MPAATPAAILTALTLLVTTTARSQIIPLPAADRPLDGTLTVPAAATIAAPAADGPDWLIPLRESGTDFQAAPQPDRATVRLLPPAADSPLAGEAYLLRVTPQGVAIHAGTPLGHLRGAQSLAALLEAAPRGADGARTLACREIADAPRFAWRGFMLDESRHFSGPTAVKRILDAMARFKLNRFHWHLTDSPGWRIEIKKYPALTRTGGRGSESDRRPDAPAAFYTQDQIREIVAYARARGIAIIPEIDMPGHADAAVAAYPEHDGGGFLQPGNKEKWRRFTFNPARPATLAFLDDVLTEVAALFPDAGIIHLGGDEVHFGWKKWPELPEVKELMKREGLKDLAAVETWFYRRMAGTIGRLGFQAGGWDEIAGRGLPPARTVVWWWRHDKPDVLRAALRDGYPVILCPRRPCYLDFVQHESHQAGRRWGGFNPLEDCYDFPAGLDLTAGEERGVLGLQGCLWAETTVTQARRDFLTWPRLVALAEAAWTPASRKNYVSFQHRLKPQLEWLRRHGIQTYDPFTHSPEVSDQGAKPEYPDMPPGVGGK